MAVAVERQPERPNASLIDLKTYPLFDLAGARVRRLITDQRVAFSRHGSISLDGFLTAPALSACVAELAPLMRTSAFHHSQRHNIYFAEDAADSHPIWRKTLESSNRTLTADLLRGSVIRQVYEWDPLREFLAAVLGKPALYRMADPLACLNVMGYGEGDQINWHFDRAEFTVTLLLQTPEAGGAFEYRSGLRSPDAPNLDGVEALLAGRDTQIRTLPLRAGTLNVFAGHCAAHRVTPVTGSRMRMVAVLSFMEQPQVMFSPADRRQFYGRAEPI